MKTVKITHGIYAAILAGITSVSTQADIIGLDSRNGPDDSALLGTGWRFADFRDTISDMGHSLVPLTTFNSSDIKDLDMLFIVQPYYDTGRFTDDEYNAIWGAVESGMGFVGMGEGGGHTSLELDSINRLVERYGVVYDVEPRDDKGRIITDLRDSPITENVTAFGVDYQRILSQIIPPAQDLTMGADSDDSLVVIDGIDGAGNVVLLSDASLWRCAALGVDYPIDTLDNRQLLKNIINYNVPTPSALMILLPVGLLFIRDRRG